MTVSHNVQPLVASDDDIRSALADAFLPPLLPALAHALGDASLLRDDLRMENAVPGADQAGMPPEQQAVVRDLAFEGIKRLRDSGPAIASNGNVEALVKAAVTWMTAGKASDEYTPLLLEELAPAEDDPRAPQWKMDPARKFRVAVIGAGMSGILAGIRLKQAGIPFVIIEKNADVGGTWFENTYPGARVDVSNLYYSYSFAQRTDWPKYFSPQEVLLDYFRSVADAYGLREHIRFDTEVESAAYDDAANSWRLRIRPPGGGEQSLEVQALVAATGQLNRPKMPSIPGMEEFEGPSFHSARWDHGVDLKGKRIAVIGTGASAAQFVPCIAPDATELHVFQRTPNWFFPVPMYHDDIPQGLAWLLTHVPHYAHWYRFWNFWMSTDGLLPAAIVDDNWPHRDRSISMENDLLRAILAGYIQGQYADRPDLLEKVLPSYPPASKRIILDNGIWASTMKRDNVELVTDPIARITRDGVVTTDGVERRADVIIYGTGFQASHFLTPMKITGRHGIDINEQWAGDARAYMGVVVPNFPNFFMLYGPNTNIVVNGSIIYFSECEVQYLMGCLRMVLEGGHAALDCRMDVHDEYNRRIDEANLKRAWGVGNTNSWYKNERGHVSQNWPFNVIQYWQQTREPNPADFVFS